MISNFGFLLPGQLAGSGHPGSGAQLRENLAWLHAQGIRAILSLTDEMPSQAMLAEAGIRILHLPVFDFTAPSPKQIEQAVAFLRESIEERQEAALVHCGSGYGRTGTILACYLVAQGRNVLDAIEEVRAKRPGSIETFEQEEAIAEYANRLGRES